MANRQPPSVAELLTAMFGECIDHQHEQVGPCVYCQPCGRRLYHGKVLTTAEHEQIRAFMNADAPKDGDSK